MENLKKYRKLQGKTQKDLATILNVAESTYRGYENGTSEPTIETLIKLANYHNVTVDYLLVDVLNNNKDIIMEEVAKFFNNCNKEEIDSYLEILFVYNTTLSRAFQYKLWTNYKQNRTKLLFCAVFQV